MTFFQLAKGELKQAQHNYEQCEKRVHGGADVEESSAAIRALLRLAKAIIEFAKGNVKESLSQLKQMVFDNPRCPSDIWFGIGLCYFRLSNLPKAKLSMDKTLELDPQNSMALTSLGVIELASNVNDFAAREKSMHLF